MATYLHLFESENEYNTVRQNNYVEPWVSATNIENDSYRVDFNLTEREKLTRQPLTFEITSDGNINWVTTDNSVARTIEYSKNGGEWTSITSNTGSSAPSISVVSGDTVQFRGDNTTYGSDSRFNNNRFSKTTAGFKAYGNIMSLIDSTGFTTATTLQSAYTFNSFFEGCTGLTDASNLILPATTLADSCYYRMFIGCSSLVNAPELPATTLANTCYREMFQGCTSLVNAPELPATTLANYCYDSMFIGCSSLVNAPELSATTLAEGCYYSMFKNCTILVNAPELPATTLANYCYRYMFSGCTSLNSITCLATNISANGCTSNWVSGVSSNGLFACADGMSSVWTRDVSGIPKTWFVVESM